MVYISSALRQIVTERANNCCEYCKLSREDDSFPFAIDHIISTKHGGDTTSDNLALSCTECNSYKGSDIASIDPQTGSATYLFHPRKQQWNQHFRLSGVRIEPLTPEGRVSVKLLRLNSTERLALRKLLAALGRYPCDVP